MGVSIAVGVSWYTTSLLGVDPMINKVVTFSEEGGVSDEHVNVVCTNMSAL